MARAVVLIVLLDALTDNHDTLNRTLHENFAKLQPNATVTLEQCNPSIVNFVLNKVKYGGTELPASNTSKSNDLTNLTHYKETTVVTKDAPDYSADTIENFIENYSNDDVENSLEKFGSNTEDFVDSAPFLVAIFETLSNVTAQTCGGTLLSTHWVITAASCINVLDDLYNNKKNSIDRSTYSVVAGSTNPFVDGSVHNVTEILLSDGKHSQRRADMRKETSFTSNSQVKLERNFSIAMMRIDPGVAVGEMAVWEGPAEEGLDVTVYGWSSLKNDSFEAIQAMSSPAKVAVPSQCRQKLTHAICLTLDSGSANNTQMGSGGAVLVPAADRARMLAVALDSRVPMLAEPLAEHAAWIQLVLNENAIH